MKRGNLLAGSVIVAGLWSSVAGAQMGGGQMGGGQMGGPPMGGPPPEAFTACQGKSVGATCSHPTPFGTMEGTCQERGSRTQCIPSRPPGGGGLGGGGPQGGGSMGGGSMGGGSMGGGPQGGGPQGGGMSGGRGNGPGNGGDGEGLDGNGNPIGSGRGPRIETYRFGSLPVPVNRSKPVAFTLPDGRTHWYEAVHLPKGGVNWVQAKSLAEQAGGYLVTFHSREENEFVLGLVRDEKFWFKWDHTHNYVMSGPFIGAFQPMGSREPDGGWRWVSGEPWTYTNWAQDGQKGDRDPRPNTQPNDSQGNSDIAALGEVNEPVATWGDFPHRFSSYRDPHEGKAYGFVIEYDRPPAK